MPLPGWCHSVTCWHSFLVSLNLQRETSQPLVISALGNKERTFGLI